MASLALCGCPSSDDIVEITDFGNARLDALLDTGKEIPKDVPIVDNDEGVIDPVDLGPLGCTSNAQCVGQVALQPCQIAVCIEDTGKCQADQAPDGSPCDDNDACTETQCTGGTCFTASELDCEDGNPCTSNHCDADDGCQTVPNFGTPCDDGNECTDEDKCLEGQCVGSGLAPACNPAGTQDDPALSCAQIKAGPHDMGSGVYWLKANDTVFKTWCEQSTMGGGWTRVAHVRGDIPMCSYVQAHGGPDDLATLTNTTGVLGLLTAQSIPFEKGEVLVIFEGQGWYAFKGSTADGWSWPVVAQGLANSSNPEAYGVQGTNTGTEWVPVTFKGCTSDKGPCLLGGNHGTTGEFGAVLGIGKYHGADKLDDACKSASKTNKGMLKGKAVTGGTNAWGQKGAIYLR